MEVAQKKDAEEKKEEALPQAEGKAVKLRLSDIPESD